MMDRYWTTSQFDSTTGEAFDFPLDVVATTLTLPDPLIDWLPYKEEKYIPTWHLVRSYIGYTKIISLELPENETLEEYDKAMEQITQDSLKDWEC